MFPCSSCERYLHAGTEKCPFCGAGISRDSSPPTVSVNQTAPGRQRLSRAASYAVRAAIVAAPGALFACDSGDTSSNDWGENTATNTGSGGSSSNSVTAGSGGNPTTSTGIAINTSTTGGEAGAGDGGSAGDIGIPIYGGPFPDMSEAKV